MLLYTFLPTLYFCIFQREMLHYFFTSLSFCDNYFDFTLKWKCIDLTHQSLFTGAGEYICDESCKSFLWLQRSLHDKLPYIISLESVEVGAED